jgi:hypothetical protein
MNFFSTIEIYEDKIIKHKLFSKKTIKLKDIKSVIISEVVEAYSFLVDRTQMKLTNNDMINFYAYKYSDFHYLKIFLNNLNEKNNIEKIIDFRHVISNKKKCCDEKGKTFNFSHVLSFSGVLFYSFIIIVTYNFIKNYNIIEYIFLLLFFILLFSYNATYFIVTKNYLIIRNSILFWKKECFELTEIESISINYHYRQFGKTIIIKTKKFQNISFVSDNLLDNTWKTLKEELKLNNILVYDNSNTTTRKVFY